MSRAKLGLRKAGVLSSPFPFMLSSGLQDYTPSHCKHRSVEERLMKTKRPGRMGAISLC